MNTKGWMERTNRVHDSVSLSNSGAALRPITCVSPLLITNEFIRARVYAGSVRAENLHGGMGVQHGANGTGDSRRIRRLCTISASFLRALDRLYLRTLHFATPNRKRRNSLTASLSVSTPGTRAYRNIWSFGVTTYAYVMRCQYRGLSGRPVNARGINMVWIRPRINLVSTRITFTYTIFPFFLLTNLCKNCKVNTLLLLYARDNE